MSVPARDDGRRTAGLAVSGLTTCYWLAVARPLWAVAVGSLVVAGERARSRPGLTGVVPDRAVAPLVAVELGVALYAAAAGRPLLGAFAGAVLLLAAWLSGPTPVDDRR